MNETLDDDTDARNHILSRSYHRSHEILRDRIHVRIAFAKLGKPIRPSGLHRADRPLDRRRGLTGSGASDMLLLLDLLNRLNHISERIDAQIGSLTVRRPPLVGVLDKTFHLLLGTAISKFEIVKHRVILLRETVERVLHVRRAAAESVDVVAHGAHRNVGHVCGLLGVAAKSVDQRRRKARRLLHVRVRAHAAVLPRILRVRHHGLLCGLVAFPVGTHRFRALPGLLGIIVQRHAHIAVKFRDTTAQLLVITVALERLLAEIDKLRTDGGNADADGGDHSCRHGFDMFDGFR